jgi:hypothetical protein
MSQGMIYTMMMINMSTDGKPVAPLICLLVATTKAHHIQATQDMGHGNPASPRGMVSPFFMQGVVFNLLGTWTRIIG